MILAAARAEWFKLVRRPAVWVTIGLLLALTVGIGYVITYLVAGHPPADAARTGAEVASLHSDLHPQSLVKKSLSNAGTLDAIFALILGVLTQGSEYAWGTVKTAQTQLPGRLAIAVGQVGSMTLLVLIMVLGTFATDALASYLIAVADGASTTFPAAGEMARGIGAQWLIFEFAAIFGFGLATMFRQSAMAMGLGLGYLLVIENLVLGLLEALGDTFKNFHQLLPVANAGYLQQAFGQVSEVVGLEISSPKPVVATRAVILLAARTLGIVACAAGVIRARDVG